VATDRRVARTKDLLHHALMALIPEKGYEAITVQDICDAANVGKSTFYAHYTSKDDLRRSGLEHMRMALAHELKTVDVSTEETYERRLRFSLPLFKHAQGHSHFYYSRAPGSGESVSLGVIRQVVSELVREEIGSGAGEGTMEDISREMVAHYIVGAYMAVLIWWLDKGAKLPPQRIDAMFQNLAAKGILAF
jgi:AcrR family transcriptional regulator